MDSYKDSVKRSIKENRDNTQKAIKDFFDRKKTEEVRLNAFKVCGTFNRENEIQTALEIANDKGEKISIRAAAMMGLVNYAKNSESFVEDLIQKLGNAETPEMLKSAILSVLQASTFGSAPLSSRMPSYNQALRSVLETSNSEETRLRAAEYLALKKDEYVQRKLMDGLSNPEKGMVPPEVAIQLLSYDLHSEVYLVLRKIAANPPNLRTKKEALRNLTHDTNPESIGLLLKTFNDKAENEEVRHLCAVGLQSLDPKLLQESVKNALLDKSENVELQVALLNTLNYSANTTLTDEDLGFQRKLQNFANASKSEKLKKTYQQYADTKLKNFK